MTGGAGRRLGDPAARVPARTIRRGDVAVAVVACVLRVVRRRRRDVPAWLRRMPTGSSRTTTWTMTWRTRTATPATRSSTAATRRSSTTMSTSSTRCRGTTTRTGDPGRAGRHGAVVQADDWGYSPRKLGAHPPEGQGDVTEPMRSRADHLLHAPTETWHTAPVRVVALSARRRAGEAGARVAPGAAARIVARHSRRAAQRHSARQTQGRTDRLRAQRFSRREENGFSRCPRPPRRGEAVTS